MTPVAPGTRPVVVLVGPPGSGKSTVARQLSERLGVAQRDTDTDVERVAGKTVADIFVEHGEAHFRELEREAVTTALATHDGVLALGGGAVLDEHAQAALAAYTGQGGTVVFLDVSLAHAAPRVGFNQARPLLLGNPRARWAALMEARRPVYERVSTVRVTTDARTPAQVATEIRALLERAETPSATGTAPAGTTSTSTTTTSATITEDPA